jgi:molybdopterin synthase sulfur carrier subunit
VESIKIRLKLFSVAKDLAGFEEKLINVPSGSPPEAVLDFLVRQNPGFSRWKPSLRIAVNMEYDESHRPLKDGDEVAIIPPVSGG